jgi:hypothetical protein
VQSTTGMFRLPVIRAEHNGDTFPVEGLKLVANDYFSKGAPGLIDFPPGRVFSDPGRQFEDPILKVPQINYRRVRDIDQMASELMASQYFVLTGSAPSGVRSKGANVVGMLGQNWEPDNFWRGKVGSPRDFFGVGLPASQFSIGASQY